VPQLDGSIGISFEKFDVLGRYRPMAADGTLLDSAGQLTLTDVDGPINSPLELATALGKSKQARECVSEKMLLYAIGRDLTSADECEQTRVAADVSALGGHLPDSSQPSSAARRSPIASEVNDHARLSSLSSARCRGGNGRVPGRRVRTPGLR